MMPRPPGSRYTASTFQGGRGPNLNSLASKERSASIDVLEQGLPRKPNAPTVVPSRTADSRDPSGRKLDRGRRQPAGQRLRCAIPQTGRHRRGHPTTTPARNSKPQSTACLYDTIYEVQVLARNASGDSPWSDSGTGRTHGLNRPPSFPDPPPGSSSLVLEVAENSPVGTHVGTPVEAIDPDGGDTLTYSLTGGPGVRHKHEHRPDHRGRQRQPRLRDHAILRCDRQRHRRQGQRTTNWRMFPLRTLQ